ncbi:GatB/YqeY domain-containing protein [Rhodobacteraceae bacterium 2376]|uniref:GatB/YqeY domain-containing protein n=1 Tax=Rhabdonatronobacter sediminivivens TaxID=2743469 RepID=A0A7Z0L002_9RHOB|nr:GatB/YqeY domain-containing protein [Rhabdonatronobacter sediminivivens]NYS24878.1 GatB/YqeY domain-containing protein [Rhabdonatronobacter sediminivivens]
MSLRDRLASDLKSAMKARDSKRLSTLRLISAAIKDRDIAARSAGDENLVPESEIRAILARMLKQRTESARTYEEAGRLELAQEERDEIEVIESYLPKQMDQDTIARAIDTEIAALGASSIRDMGRVMAAMKEKYAGQMDFAQVGPMVKARLSV